MKKIILSFVIISSLLAGCATVQSIIKSTFPYTSSLIIPASSKINTTLSATSSASSFDQIFGNQNGTNYIKEVRIASVRLDASNPTNQNLGVFKSVKIFLVNGAGAEVMVASRNDVSENIGNNLVLDIDNSRFVDEYVKGNNLRVRMEYTLRSSLSSDVSVRAAINFNSTPNTN
ncbi:hypothetical protein EZ428_01980 [Pedobacter frigiditerrae]|uniref:Uncharacterized protein n=1 Tax=Pedobacter frigiditerrae TaxID=2530452 RepID=A0A4R0N2N3_9SPHI|nr:hypothetical protein [Pedobacter frigiditerrae]TCC93563.1 hypothetical protein EZ428_01980 [Pedobacter frigiditerrae]